MGERSRKFLTGNCWWEGVCAKIVDTIFVERKHEFIVGAWVWEETRRTLHEKFDVSWSLIDEYETKLLRKEGTTWQETPLALSPYKVTDADDRVVLACALTADSDVLITGDKALLDVADQVRRTEGLLIIEQADFWKRKGELW